MNTELVIIGSITYTMKAKSALTENGIKARIRKLQPRNRSGCSYGLELPEGSRLTVASILRPLNIPYEPYKG